MQLCHRCKQQISGGMWARDNIGMYCRECWEYLYPRAYPTHFIVPSWIKSWTAWILPEAQTRVAVLPGEYEVSFIDDKRNAVVFWIWNEHYGVESPMLHSFDSNYISTLRVRLMREDPQSSISGYIPVITLLDVADVCGILYRKLDGAIRTRPVDLSYPEDYAEKPKGLNDLLE